MRWIHCGEQQRSCGQFSVDSPATPNTLDVVRYPSTRPEQRIGTLIFNAGGPGLSNVTLLDALMKGSTPEVLTQLQQYFDLIAYDPRGVSDVERLHCATLADVSNAPLREITDFQQRSLDLTQSTGDCPETWAQWSANDSTQTHVEDLEAIRLGLGESQLNLMVMSYGAQVATRYAQKYPQQVRALLIDASMNPSNTLTDMALDITNALQSNLRWLLTQCSDCQDTLEPALLAAKQRVANKPPQTQALFMQLARRATQLEFGVPGGLQVLKQLSQIQSAADVSALIDNGESTAPVNDGAYRSTLCADYPERPSAEDVFARQIEFTNASALFGDGEIGLGLLCSGWPEATHPLPELTGPLDEKIHKLIISGTLDANTPLTWGMNMANHIGANHLFSQHSGHSVLFRRGGNCATHAATQLFIEQKLPLNNGFCL